MIRAFYVGRFQPFHNGHARNVELISREVDEIVIGIGSAQKSHTTKNPFTAGERIEMISKALKKFTKLHYIIPLEDVEYNALWVSHVCSMSPKFDVVYANNPLVIQLFTEAGIEVRNTPLHERDKLSGTAIRKVMLECENDEWTDFVPPEVVDVIRDINGIERMRNLNRSDRSFRPVI